MATILTFEGFKPAFSDLRDNARRKSGTIGANHKRPEKFAGRPPTGRNPWIVGTNIPASFPLASAHREGLTARSATQAVRGSTGGVANIRSRVKRQRNERGSCGTERVKRTLGATCTTAQTIHAAVLFADMRGYTGLAERLPPAEVLPLLEKFIAILARVTQAFGGYVFHVAGDSMMAGFAVLDPQQSAARAALATAQAMLQSFAPVADRWRRKFGLVTGIGIGIHQGEVALAFLGSAGKQAITLVGDTPNVAACLCSRARTGEVLFSGAVAAAFAADGGGPGSVPQAFLQLPQFELRGRHELLDIWCTPAPERLGHAPTTST